MANDERDLQTHLNGHCGFCCDRGFSWGGRFDLWLDFRFHPIDLQMNW